MKRYLLILLVLCSGLVYGQSAFEIGFTPGLGYRTISASTGTSSEFIDSVKQMDKVRQNWGISTSFIHGFNRDHKLQMGLFYRRVSFTRVIEDLQFQDTVHPSIGRIEDLSQNGQKNAYLYNRYHYLSIPIVLQTFIGPEYGRTKYSIHFISGLSADILIQDDIKIFLQGYSIKGKSVHIIDSDYDASAFNLNVILGGRVEIPIGEKLNFNLQPNFSFPLLATSSDSYLSMRLYQMNLKVGVSLDL
jgi:hypothetical protein